ncbi:putative E3 ubiquitin-protein ligase SH3RF1 [Hypsibius exemplaris]|uniref:E3 ubiquitin-protein ligase SH3RF1 n=1 Tax=Hypsibius exemplaris TaxID=2072580 RepID=A0A1W0WIS5_HYPEX|nr:putative E3 ubiquitin-protein ligase SH3RF1 [Hypsibius exemplaris]
MDEQTLNILLECPVCLNTLNETSRVLPCQHTFCITCLEDIIGRRGCLLCPECRTVVTTSIENLPRNILLMRLLEGLKSRRNSNVHLSQSRIESGAQRFCKSSPCTPDYASSASSFAFLFPYQRSQSDGTPTDDSAAGSSRALHASTSDHHLSPREPNLFHRRTSAISIITQPPTEMLESGLDSSRRRGLRASRTTTDLSSLSISQIPMDLPVHSSSIAAEQGDQYGPVPTISFTEPGQSATTAAQVLPVYPDAGTFNQANWRQSAHNRSLPSHHHPVTDPEGESSSSSSVRRTAAIRTTSHPVVQPATPVPVTPIPAAAILPIYRSWMVHPSLEPEPQARNAVMEVLFSGQQPSRSSSQHVFAGNQRGYVKPVVPAEAMIVPSVKESRSFIKTLFGGHKNHHSSSQNLLAQKFTSLSTNEQDTHRSAWHAYGEDKSKKACVNTFRSAATRYSKPANFECYRCVTPYPAKNHYELDLHLNDLLYVHQKHSDGWMKATHERTGRNGLIPIAFVERLHGSVSSS